MKHRRLTREELSSVIEGRGAAERIPAMIHFWVHPDEFGERKPEVQELLKHYPTDVQRIDFVQPQLFDAPKDDPEYRWANFANPNDTKCCALDEIVAIEDWGRRLDGVMNNFPSADYPGLFPYNPEEDGRYRLGTWWRFYYEWLWTLRGMTNALIDFYEHPDEIHRLFTRLTDFYCRLLERAKAELNLDGILVSDDFGTQHSTFFNPDLFDEFFAPYYRQVIEKARSLGIHFWLHSCGNIEKLIPKLIDVGVDVLHPIQKHTMDEKRIAEQFGDQFCILAGFDVQQVIPWGTPEEVREEVRFLIDTYARPEGRLMLTAGNGINGDCPVQSLEALLDETVIYRPAY